MIARRSKFLKADGPTAHLDGECWQCAERGHRRPVWRQGLCASHFKRQQRGKPVSGPIGQSVMPGGLQLGEVPTAKELLVNAATAYVECDSEDDAAFAKCDRGLEVRALRFAESKGYLKSADALELAKSFGWKPPHQHGPQRTRRAHHHRRPQHTQLELPFIEFFHEPDWADERRP